jgi:hypothetical protein
MKPIPRNEHRLRMEQSYPTAPRWLDSLLPEGAEPLPAAHILTPRRGYLHHGIYVGDDRVVHYAGFARGVFRGPVEEVSLADFAQGRRIWTRWTDQPSYGSEEVIRRARSRVGENQYELLRNNCEHFCEWCLRGAARSFQVERFFTSRKALLRLLLFLAILSEGQASPHAQGLPERGACAR